MILRCLLYTALLYLSLFVGKSLGQSITARDSIYFDRKYHPAPNDCAVIGNSFLNCMNYDFIISYLPLKEFKRVKKEMVSQLNTPRKISVSIFGNKTYDAYLSKAEDVYMLVMTCKINREGYMISLYMSKPIESTNDLPEYVRHFITINP